MATDSPSSLRCRPNVPRVIMDAQTARRLCGDGSFGGAYRAAEAVMQEIFAACLQDVLGLLQSAA